MGKLIKCDKCGVFFGQESSETVCSKCRVSLNDYSGVEKQDLEETLYLATKSFVLEHPKVSPEEIIDHLADNGLTITRKKIMGYVDEGKLELVSIVGKSYCEMCAKEIVGGRFCPSCRRVFESNLNISSSKTPSPTPTKSHVGMHIKHK